MALMLGGEPLRRRFRRLAVVGAIGVLGIVVGVATAANTDGLQSTALSRVAAFNRLPGSDFPAKVMRTQQREVGTLTFRLSALAGDMSLNASAGSISHGLVGTITRSSTDFVLRFTQLRYRVDSIKLPNGINVASQTITLDPKAQSTLRIDRRTGVATSDLHWVVDAPNVLYNGSHTIEFPDKGQRRFVSFKQIGPRRYSFSIISKWHGSVTLTRWSVAGTALPAGHVAISGTWDGYYALSVAG